MTLQFLPWARRGLAAEITAKDTGAPLAARASLPVSLTVSGHRVTQQIQTWGPGEITGLDTATITRCVPARNAPNAPPDEFAAVEFDTADLPWLFTPAAAGAEGRLRPWLVLIVVRRGDGVAISLKPNAPLPVLSISAPMVPAQELPDLSQSWAWAHAQIVTDTAGGATPDLLNGAAHTSLARLLCPRRLHPAQRYIAALVPAFDLGVMAGLGQSVSASVAGPAWTSATLGDAIDLPVYYHWDFTTGPAGDFESLARKLVPMPAPEGVGRARMSIAAAHPALPAVPPNAGVVPLEGALRAPQTSTTDGGLAAALTPWRDALCQMIDDGQAAVTGGSSSTAEAVAPPIWGQWHALCHTIPAEGKDPRWLRGVNSDPRHRANAGLGAEVVRANQEDYVDAAWRQAGEVMAANRALDLTRGLGAVADRVHQRHVAGLDPLRALPFVDQARLRLPIGGMVLDSLIAASRALPGIGSRSFRRIASPQSPTLRAASLRSGQALSKAGSVAIEGLNGLANGKLRVDFGLGPDGLTANRLTAMLPDLPKTLPKAVLTRLATDLSASQMGLASGGRGLQPQPDLGRQGLITDRHIAQLRAALGSSSSLWGGIATLRSAAKTVPADEVAAGFLVTEGRIAAMTLTANDRIAVSMGTASDRVVLPRKPTAGQPTLRPLRADRLRGAVDPVSRPDLGLYGQLQAELGAGVLDLGPAAKLMDSAGQTTAVSPRLVAPLITDRIMVKSASEAMLAAHAAIAARAAAFKPLPALPPLDLKATAEAIRLATQPLPLAKARVAARLSAGGRDFAAILAQGRLGTAELFQPAGTDPVMVCPVLDRPLYRDLARFDPERLLPGAGDVPENAVLLLETNPRFVEAFLVGANHEMNRELLWRRYPTDRRGTVFRRFWDRTDGSDDIRPIHEWPRAARLGSIATGAGAVVVLLRGELLRRFPSAILYAAPATADRRIDTAAQPIGPVFSGNLAPDLSFVGFDFDLATALAGNGMMFVVQEQPSEPRFGLDAASGAARGAPAVWSDLSWSHSGTPLGGYLDMSAFGGPVTRPLRVGPGAPRFGFGTDSAGLAAITFQRPFRAALHFAQITG